MPRDRLRSPRAGHGRKTTSLTDFEFRVWDQWQLSADDFGVMRFGPYKLKEDNGRLAKCDDAEIMAALDRIVEVGLALRFEHQGVLFICDPTWQEFQKVEYPHTTLMPKPPSSVLLHCNPPTRKLFQKHPGGSSGRSKSGSPKDHRRITGGSPASRDQLTANGTSANGKGHTADAAFEQFWAGYPRKVAKPKARAAFVKLRADGPLLAAILAGIERHKASRQWLRDDGEYIPHPATFLNQRRWEDQPAALKAAKPRVGSPEYYASLGDWFAECKQLHGGACGNSSAHRTRLMLDEARTQEPV